MKFEVTNMLLVHTTAVKRILLELLSSAWLFVYGVIAFTATGKMTSYIKLRAYVSMWSRIIKKEVSVVCPFEGSKAWE